MTLGMSSPDSIIVVQTNTSASPSAKASITSSNSASGIWPWPIINLASGISSANSAAVCWMVRTRLWRKKTWPPRSISRRMASRIVSSLYSETKVLTGSRASGGVFITLISRIPVKAMCRVRGMGVALRVRTSTWLRSRFSVSLWPTPNRCSSSTTTSPRFLNLTSFWSNRWVPITMSTVPASNPASTSCCSFGVRNRLNTSTCKG